MSKFLILLCIYMPLVMSKSHLLDRFFGKPVNESMNIFRNPNLFPKHVYRYVDEESVCIIH